MKILALHQRKESGVERNFWNSEDLNAYGLGFKSFRSFLNLNSALICIKELIFR